MRMIPVLLAPLLISSLLFSLASDPPNARVLFAEAPWYRQAAAKERTYEGVLRKEASPMATSGRWNPVRLITDQQNVHPIYLGSDTHLLDPYLGRRVRLEGKAMEVLGQQEIWPARITPIHAPSES
jgi:hypothetical protein